MPEQSGEVSIHDLVGKPLTGWDEIRQVVMCIEQLSEKQRGNGARVEVYEYGKESSVKVSFSTLKELEEYQESRFRKLLLNVEKDSVPDHFPSTLRKFYLIEKPACSDRQHQEFPREEIRGVWPLESSV